MRSYSSFVLARGRRTVTTTTRLHVVVVVVVVVVVLRFTQFTTISPTVQLSPPPKNTLCRLKFRGKLHAIGLSD